MTTRKTNRNTILGLLSLIVFLGCEDKSHQSTNNTSEQSPVEQQASVAKTTPVAKKSEIVVPKIELTDLPAPINLDPCQLLTAAELGEIGLPNDQHIAQLGFSKQLPNHSPITPFVGCKWRAVDQGIPLAWIHVQHITRDFKPDTKEQFGLGDISWQATSQGREHLMVKMGDRLLMIASQIPYNDKSEMETNIWIAGKVLSRLSQITESTRLKSANASEVGGPSLDICDVSKAAKPYELLQGNVAWSFPNIEINRVPSQKKRPQEDGVSCIYSSSRRGAVYVTYLGNDGVKRWNQYFEKNGDKIAFNGSDAFKDRKKLYIPLEQGAIMVEAQGIKYFSDEEIDEKISDIANTLLEQLK